MGIRYFVCSVFYNRNKKIYNYESKNKRVEKLKIILFYIIKILLEFMFEKCKKKYCFLSFNVLFFFFLILIVVFFFLSSLMLRLLFFWISFFLRMWFILFFVFLIAKFIEILMFSKMGILVFSLLTVLLRVDLFRMVMEGLVVGLIRM